MPGPDRLSPLQRLWDYATPLRRKAVVAAVFSILNKIFDVLPEVLIGVAIDIVVAREESFLARLGLTSPGQQLAVLAFITFLIWLLESITEYGALVRWRNLAQQLQHALRMDGVRHIQKLSLSWYEKQNSGRLLSILNDDVNQVERFLNEGTHKFIQLFVSSLLVSAVFFYLSPLVAVFALLPIPLILYGGFRFRGRLAGRYAAVREAASMLGARLSGIITGVVTIRAAVAEDEQVQLVHESSQNYIETNRQAIALSSAFVPIIRMSVLAGFLFTLVLGGWQTLQGELSPAAYTVLVFLTQRLLWPFTAFGELLDLFERSMASAKRTLDLITAPVGIIDPPQTQALGRSRGALRFQAVDFAYADAPPLLKNFNLDIQPGEFIGLVGPTGAGKSTIIKLLLRFYDPTRGQVLIDDIPLTQLSQKELRRNIGYVGQDVFLLDTSIRQNLKMGKPELPDERLWEALDIAAARDFVAQMPEGLDTSIGERGQRLSGGQRQRLTIARGILGDPPILIFDEATSAVDNETEEVIQRSLQKLAHQRTLIVIAHRLSTIRHADRILVLADGQVMESGKHEELLQTNGLYARLWKIQTGTNT
ncbi:ABC transporter ATP-binding protein [Oligoflexus tunisiensis]|uniref:ABC transporter ATP-binding protein n=1 Tax=Oligoflexus tunisiensis TaxID=708132 RepID=UPI000AEC8BE0|nr:ABC transporter ATP-binding protein [Oligoflexus tunisiensis]